MCNSFSKVNEILCSRPHLTKVLSLVLSPTHSKATAAVSLASNQNQLDVDVQSKLFPVLN